LQRAALRLLGHTVREHRQSRGWSQETLGEKTGLTQTYVSEIENGDRNPSILVVLGLCRAFEITPGELLRDFTPAALRRLRLK
jgi:transcriptional regulator with XRE-family HTH domain